jgi:hypothetical protein
MPKPRGARATVKTTIDLPEQLWRAAKVRAIDERTDLRGIVIAALKLYLGTTKGGAK